MTVVSLEKSDEPKMKLLGEKSSKKIGRLK